MPDFTFGKRNHERPQEGGGFEMYIKNFDEGKHRTTVLEDDPEKWMTVFEHYDHGLKVTYPCAIKEGALECVGCNYPVQNEDWSDLDTHFPGMSWSEQKDARKKADPGWGVRDLSKKYIFPCIDAKGYISIYKASGDLWKKFVTAYEDLGSLLTQEFIVTREGKGFGTTVNVTAVPGEPRKPKYPVPGQAEISEALGRKYAYALEKYGVDGGQPVAQPDPAPVTSVRDAADEAQATVQVPEPTGDTAADELAARRAHAEAKGAAPSEPVSSPAHGFIPREASTGEIKDWLAALDPPVEFNPKAARGVLVGLAEKTMTEREILPY